MPKMETEPLTVYKGAEEPKVEVKGPNSMQKDVFKRYMQHTAKDNQEKISIEGDNADMIAYGVMSNLTNMTGFKPDSKQKSREVVGGYLQATLQSLSGEYSKIFTTRKSELISENKTSAEIDEEMFDLAVALGVRRLGMDPNEIQKSVQIVQNSGVRKGLKGLRQHFLDDGYLDHSNSVKWAATEYSIDDPFALRDLIIKEKSFQNHFKEGMKNGIIIKNSHRQTLDNMIAIDEEQRMMKAGLGIQRNYNPNVIEFPKLEKKAEVPLEEQVNEAA